MTAFGEFMSVNVNIVKLMIGVFILVYFGFEFMAWCFGVKQNRNRSLTMAALTGVALALMLTFVR
jgi:hypothetical protein